MVPEKLVIVRSFLANDTVFLPNNTVFDYADNTAKWVKVSKHTAGIMQKKTVLFRRKPKIFCFSILQVGSPTLEFYIFFQGNKSYSLPTKKNWIEELEVKSSSNFTRKNGIVREKRPYMITTQNIIEIHKANFSVKKLTFVRFFFTSRYSNSFSEKKLDVVSMCSSIVILRHL